MRTYPRNSPRAAARIVALALIADGHLSRTELEALDCCSTRERLGIAAPELHAVVQELCEDLLATSHGVWSGAGGVGPAELAAVMDEVDDPLLRLNVLQMCLAAVAADGDLADGESAVVQAALDRWGALRRDDARGRRLKRPAP